MLCANKEGICVYIYLIHFAVQQEPTQQQVKNTPAMQETRFQPWVRKIPWRREWLPTPVFLPEKSHGQRSLAGYSPWGCKKHKLMTKPLPPPLNGEPRYKTWHTWSNDFQQGCQVHSVPFQKMVLGKLSTCKSVGRQIYWIISIGLRKNFEMKKRSRQLHKVQFKVYCGYWHTALLLT